MGLPGAVAELLIAALQALAQGANQRQYRDDLAADGKLHLVQGLGPGGILHGDDQAVLPDHQGHGLETDGQGFSDPGQRL